MGHEMARTEPHQCLCTPLYVAYEASETHSHACSVQSDTGTSEPTQLCAALNDRPMQATIPQTAAKASSCQSQGVHQRVLAEASSPGPCARNVQSDAGINDNEPTQLCATLNDRPMQATIPQMAAKASPCQSQGVHQRVLAEVSSPGPCVRNVQSDAGINDIVQFCGQ